jgi:hypothetical protein
MSLDFGTSIKLNLDHRVQRSYEELQNLQLDTRFVKEFATPRELVHLALPHRFNPNVTGRVGLWPVVAPDTGRLPQI